MTTDIAEQYGVESYTVAGGALRDSLMNREITDIDIFISRGDYLKLSKVIGEETLPTTSKNPKKTYQFMNGKVDDRRYPYPINFIGRPDYRFVTKDFDFNICKVSYSNGHGLSISQSFLNDIQNKTLTCVEVNEGRLESAQNHLNRLLVKYPDYNVIDEYSIGVYDPKTVWE